MPALQTLSIKDARKLAIQCQGLLSVDRSGTALDATHRVLEKIGYVQIDTISVVARAHHHTLWNRSPRYRPEHLHTLMQQGRVFEYWSHAAAYLPMSDYRYSLLRKREVREGDVLWFRSEAGLRRKVLERITIEGPLQSRDFADDGKASLSMWEWKPVKYALEHLSMQGELMVVRRDKFQKVYDLTERVLPCAVNTRVPTRQEQAEHLVKRYLAANGLGDATHMAYLRKGWKTDVQAAIATLLEAGEIELFQVNGRQVCVWACALDVLNAPMQRSKVKILSPFDNLVIQRQRINWLFDFDFKIECYVPQHKRRFGYFCLPVLWDGGLAGWIDCKADRRHRTLLLKGMEISRIERHRERFLPHFSRALQAFAAMNDCQAIVLSDALDKALRGSLQCLL